MSPLQPASFYATKTIASNSMPILVTFSCIMTIYGNFQNITGKFSTRKVDLLSHLIIYSN